MTFEQVAEEISKATGRNITYQSITVDEYKTMLRKHQVPEGYIWLMNYLFTEILDGRNSNVTKDVEKILGRKAKDFTDYTRETANAGIWDVDKHAL